MEIVAFAAGFLLAYGLGKYTVKKKPVKSVRQEILNPIKRSQAYTTTKRIKPKFKSEFDEYQKEQEH